MADQYKIDSHKLIYHPARTAEYLEKGDTFPIYLEISPSGGCNHRCTFCGMDHRGYVSRFIDTELIKTRISEMAGLGLKSIMFAGEGEPLLHKDIVDIVNHTKSVGIDSSFTTNAVLLNEKKANGLLPNTSWIKVSCNAGSAETYAKVHRSGERDFEKVMKNIKTTNEIRKVEGHTCTLGAQMILLPENRHEAVELGKRVRDLGADYLVIKPYSQNASSITTIYKDVRYDEELELQEQLDALKTDSFKVIFRSHAMKKHGEVHAYSSCNALPFWAYIGSEGNIWGCSDFVGNEDFNYGNINDMTVKEIWYGKQRKDLMDKFNKSFNCSQCRTNCRMDDVNKYLWELKNPAPHDNFI